MRPCFGTIQNSITLKHIDNLQTIFDSFGTIQYSITLKPRRPSFAIRRHYQIICRG